ncbi:hypothetical protein [Christiangramia sp.]|nr:hypothetical protein [Christiangramia sp.]
MKDKTKCTHNNQTTIVLNAICGVEIVAEKCQDCGELIKKRFEN